MVASDLLEHVAGDDLRRATDEGRLTGSQVVGVLCDVVAALQRAHSRAIVHRDVKPANVLLGADARAKLADFGLAPLPRSSASFRTVANRANCTPAYMAPEQIEDADLDADAHAYAFALIAYELLTGERPFAARDVPTLLQAHQHETPTPPRHFVPDLPRPVGRILLGHR